jgi:hypothetical protein
MTTRRAACNCGNLEIVCEGEPVRISMCHCLDSIPGSAAGTCERDGDTMAQRDGGQRGRSRPPLLTLALIRQEPDVAPQVELNDWRWRLNERTPLRGAQVRR